MAALLLRSLYGSIVYLLVSCYFCIVPCICINYADWSTGNTSMPQGANCMAIAYDSVNDTIWLIGGDIGQNPNYKQLTSFTNNQFINHGTTFLSGDGVYGQSQYYAQLNNILYIINIEGNALHTFNIATQSIQYDYHTAFATSVGFSACLASIDRHDGYLLVIGGQSGPFSFLSTTQILNLTSNQWMPNAPNMTQSRGHHACIVYKDIAYAIGGDNGQLLDSVETLNVSQIGDITETTWSTLPATLLYPLADHRAVLYDDQDDILIFGGRNTVSTETNNIMVLHTNTTTIVSNGSIAFAAKHLAAVIAPPFIYLFGGENNANAMYYANIWQYHLLPTASPTKHPITQSPTNYPSVSPTYAPSHSTATPTRSPSQSPTLRPTLTEKYLYVTKEGCDYGYCTSYSTDYTNDVCVHQIDMLDDNQAQCCPTNAPTGVNITSSPTLEPTLQPSSSSTVINRTLCDSTWSTQAWCYSVDLYPSNTRTVHEIPITAVSDTTNNDLYFIIDLTSNGYDCVEPQISFTFEEIDFESKNEYIHIYDTHEVLITTCDGTADANCGVWLQCMDQQPLRDIRHIKVDENYTISIVQPRSVDALCNSLSINAKLNITCSSGTASPTSQTESPTSGPSTAPTVSPKLHTCGTSNCIQDIYPSLTQNVTSTIRIRSNETYITSRFRIQDAECVNPTVSVYFRDHDMDEPDEYLRIYYQTSLPSYELAECGSAVYGQCDKTHCLNHSSIFGIASVPASAMLVLVLESGSGIDLALKCNDTYVLWIDVSLHCEIIHRNITDAPTVMTTEAPTSSPTYEPTCLSINYSWNCFWGRGGTPNTNGCEEQGYSGNGVFDLGDGTWEFPYNISVADKDIMIRGQGPHVTVWKYTGHDPIWVQCEGVDCWLRFHDLSIASSVNNTGDAKQFYMDNGGELYTKNVLFDGRNYAQNTRSPLWEFGGRDGNRGIVIFEDCNFTNNDVMYHFKEGVTARFIHCRFEGNNITRFDNDFDVYEAMFYVDHSNVIFEDCLFDGNVQYNRYMFMIVNGGYLDFEHCVFSNNVYNQSLFDISDGYWSFNNSVFTANNAFRMNSSVIHIVEATANGSLTLNDCVFDDNRNIDADIICNFNPNMEVSIYNTRFTDYSVHNLKWRDCDLRIDQSSVSNNNTISFGHDPTYNGGNITLYLLYFEPQIGAQNFDFVLFGAENGSVVFEPCDEQLFAPDAYPTSMFDTISADITPSKTFSNKGEFFEGVEQCDASLCYIGCTELLSCFAATFNLNASNMSLLNCQSDTSCSDSTISISSSTYGSIQCNETDACKEATIDIHNVANFTLECISTHSCIDMTVNITNTRHAIIQCYDHNACKSMTVHSDSDDLVQYFYNFNEKVVVHLPEHHDADHDHNDVHCDPMNAYLSPTAGYNSSSSFEKQISALYLGDDPPCTGVLFQPTNDDIIPCDLQYEYTEYTVDVKDYMKCYPPVYLSTITAVKCYGTASPTTDPTSPPTTEPTVDPTDDPTSDPTFDPTNNPSISPTRDPTVEPTVNPTIYPTINPTTVPTVYPTTDPTIEPTFNPTSDPTNDPTMDPTSDPTVDPTSDPTVDPTRYPTDVPTRNPTMEPTLVPTHVPTEQPTVPPTKYPSSSPTHHPSVPPTQQPTRLPTTSDLYTAFFKGGVRCQIGNLSEIEIQQFIDHTNSTINDIIKIIEKGFFDLSNFNYFYFWVRLHTIKGEYFDAIEYDSLVGDLGNDVLLSENVFKSRKWLTLETDFLCQTEEYCGIYIDTYDKQSFEENVQSDLRMYFDSVYTSMTNAASDIRRNSTVSFVVLNSLSKRNIKQLNPPPWAALFDFDTLPPALLYNFIPFMTLCVLYVVCIVCIVSNHNRHYYRLLTWMVYFWLYVNCMFYWKYCGIIYAMNILHVLYIHCRYGNEWKHYSKYNTNHEDGKGRDGSETVSKVSRLSNMVLKSQTNGFLFFSIIAGVPASLQLSKSRIYRHRIFSLPIADHFWMKLFRDIGFLFLLLIYYGILVIPAVRIVMDTDVVKDWNMACILLGTMVALCHIIYLVFKFRIKHYEYSDNHDVFQIKAHFKNALEREHIFTPVHTNYEKDMTKIIDSYLDNSTHIKYFSEVLDIDTHNHDLIISIFVSWKYEDDRLNGSINIAEIIEMEIDFREQLISEIRFAPRITLFCGFGNKPSSNQEPPQISIEGKYSTEHLHSYQTGRFENKNDTDLQELKRNIFNEIKPLYTMTNADICNIIKYWFLSDIKYRAYNKDVMKIIRDKNVNGIVLQDLSTKKMNTKLYLSDLFGRYFEPEMIDVITKKLFPHETKGGKANETTDFVNLSTIDSYQLAKTICTLRMDRIGNRLMQSSDCIDGNWFTNAVNPKKPFMSKLIDELAINDEDAVQIYKLLKTFDVPKGSDIEVEIIEATTSKLSEDIKIDNIKQLSSEPFPINLETLALKLKNNLSLRQESEVLMNLFYHLVTVNATPDKPVNYGLYNHLYEIYASVFGQTCLNEWWCSECCYHNRRIKINSSFLNRDSPFMKACIICGTDKKTAIITTLKGESKQKCLMDVDANADEFSCEDGTIGKCIACQKIMEFLRKYEEHELDYPSILSTMNCTEVATHILVPSIQQLTDETDVLLNAFAINTIDGKLLCTLEEDVFRAMMGVVLEGNNQLSAGTVKHFYDLMYSQCDTYVKEARESIFGSSCSQLMHFWKHCLNKHMNSYSDDCSKNLFKCKEQQHADAIPEHAEAEPDHKSQEFDQLIQECAVCLELKKLDSCNDTRCVALSRNVDRFQLINSKSATTKSKARDSVYGELRIDIEKLPCNLHIKHQMQNDRYFQYELDSIHTHLLHDIHDVELLDLPFVKKASRKRESNKQSVIFAEPPVSLIELEELKEQGMANPTIPMNASHFKAMATEFASNKSKYTTDIGLYGFGIDHRHQYLKPHGSNQSMRDEMMDCGFVTPSAWDVTLNKAFNKKKQIIDKKDYVARQFNSDYNIHRGDPIGIHHLMAICFYTDFSRLCTDYRSTFRRVDSKDSND
eukprot:935548_1